MLASERQQLIKELINSQKNLKISDLSGILGVSDMTVHRDIKVLVEEGIVEKTFGGIRLIDSQVQKPNVNECVVCSRTIDHRLYCQLILTNNRVETACCPHCGIIRHQMLGNEVVEILCCDFFTNTTISAIHAWYVMDTSIDLSCCMPQVLPFKQKEHADGFVRGFGGTVLTFEQASQKVIGQEYSHRGCCDHES
jgi:DeoR family transcriptional regulator, copper-sensing transcriptional repressor